MKNYIVVVQQFYEDIVDVQIFSDIEKAINYIYKFHCEELGAENVSYNEIKDYIMEHGFYGWFSLFNKNVDAV